MTQTRVVCIGRAQDCGVNLEGGFVCARTGESAKVMIPHKLWKRKA